MKLGLVDSLTQHREQLVVVHCPFLTVFFEPGKFGRDIELTLESFHFFDVASWYFWIVEDIVSQEDHILDKITERCPCSGFEMALASAALGSSLSTSRRVKTTITGWMIPWARMRLTNLTYGSNTRAMRTALG